MARPEPRDVPPGSPRRDGLPIKPRDQRGQHPDTLLFWACLLWLVGRQVAEGRALDVVLMVLIGCFAMAGEARKRRRR